MKTLSRGCVLLALLILPASAPAQGSAFTYQGRLVDSGQPANGNYDLQFKLADAASNGNYVGATLNLAPVAASNGLFTVTLDFGEAVFDGSGRWLEIGVRTDGSGGAYTVLSPRQAITATPYAAFAGGAATAGQATSLAPGATIVANGAGITNLNGAYIQPESVGTNQLSGWINGQLALAGSGGGGLAAGGTATNITVVAQLVATGTNTIYVANAGTTIVNGNYLFDPTDELGIGFPYYTNVTVQPDGNYGITVYDPTLSVLPTVWTICDYKFLGTKFYYTANAITGPWTAQDGSLPVPTVGYGSLSPALTVNGNLTVAGTAALAGAVSASGTVTFGSNVTFTVPPVGSGAGLTNVQASWTNITDQPISLTVKPGTQRTFLAPPYSVNLWNSGGLPQSATTLTNVAQDFLSIFGSNAGPTLLALDDGWQGDPTHDANHFLLPNTNYFPQGVRPVADYLHSLGFKLGMYLAYVNLQNDNNCWPVQEAQSLANWGVDYIKFDGVLDIGYLEQFVQTIDSIYLSTNRSPMFIMAHIDPASPVYDDPELKVLLDAQFATGDIPIYFLSTMDGYVQIGVNHAYFSTYVPEAASIIDPGEYPTSAVTNGFGIKAELGIQAMISSVRTTYQYDFASGHVIRPPDAVVSALTNADVLAINQDPAQIVGWPAFVTSSNQIWIKPLGSPEGPEWAVAMWNSLTSSGETQTLSFSLGNIPQATRPMWAKELWSGATQLVSGVLTVTNQPSELKLFRLTPYQTTVLTGTYASSPAALSGTNAIWFAHRLGGTPQMVRAVLRCVSNDPGTGYAAGDEVDVNGWFNGAGGQPMFSVSATAAVVVVARAANMNPGNENTVFVIPKAGGSYANPSSIGNWRLVVYAQKL